MNLLILQVIYNKDTFINTEHKSKEIRKLFKVFCNDYGMHRSGQTFYKIQRMLTESSHSEVVCKHKRTCNEDSILNICNNIEEDLPVVMSVSGGNWGHTMLAIGYEKLNNEITRIFCLDPSGDYLYGRKRWNAEIIIGKSSNVKNKYMYKSRIRGIMQTDNVSLDDILILYRDR